MPIAEDQIVELKHAYQVFGLPLSASAFSIKQMYRMLMKRWHPDLYPSGTEAYAEATQMTKIINEAYSAIGNAPLRYYVDASPAGFARSMQGAGSSKAGPVVRRSDTLPKTDWMEFWVRFICGALFGTLISFRWFLFYFNQPGTMIIGTLSVILLCGFGAARGGDNFWHSRLYRWWIWW
jgi:DnaJ-like protein